MLFCTTQTWLSSSFINLLKPNKLLQHDNNHVRGVQHNIIQSCFRQREQLERFLPYRISFVLGSLYFWLEMKAVPPSHYINLSCNFRRGEGNRIETRKIRG